MENVENERVVWKVRRPDGYRKSLRPVGNGLGATKLWAENGREKRTTFINRLPQVKPDSVFLSVVSSVPRAEYQAVVSIPGRPGWALMEAVAGATSDPMKSHWVVDGHERLLGSRRHQERLRELKLEIQARHAGALASAGWLGRWQVKRRIASEFRRERRAIEPSPSSCYLAR